MKPIRIQRKRTKGWKKPSNTVCVDRSSRWGNPFKVGNDGDARQCVRLFHDLINPYRHLGPTATMEHFLLSVMNMAAIQRDLRGKNLACYCALDAPCHADVLLFIANDEVDYGQV